MLASEFFHQVIKKNKLIEYKSDDEVMLLDDKVGILQEVFPEDETWSVKVSDGIIRTNVQNIQPLEDWAVEHMRKKYGEHIFWRPVVQDR